jgi:hypothetical protein
MFQKIMNFKKRERIKQSLNSMKKIKDLNQASFLKLKRLKLLGKVEWDGDVAYWVFDDNGQADQLIETYINDEAIGNLKDFAEIQRSLKQMLFK